MGFSSIFVISQICITNIYELVETLDLVDLYLVGGTLQKPVF